MGKSVSSQNTLAQTHTHAPRYFKLFSVPRTPGTYVVVVVPVESKSSAKSMPGCQAILEARTRVPLVALTLRARPVCKTLA